MSLKEISNGYLNQFINNPKKLDLFLMHRNIEKLILNINKQAMLDKQQTEDLTI